MQLQQTRAEMLGCTEYFALTRNKHIHPLLFILSSFPLWRQQLTQCTQNTVACALLIYCPLVAVLAGRFCEYAYKTTDQTTLYETFEQFSQTLERRCDPGEPAFLNWTVDIETPNVVYYQVSLNYEVRPKSKFIPSRKYGKYLASSPKKMYVNLEYDEHINLAALWFVSWVSVRIFIFESQ